jgi:hypothetical protein
LVAGAGTVDLEPELVVAVGAGIPFIELSLAIDNELRTASTEHVFGKYSVDVSAVVAVGDKKPRRIFAGSF